MGVQHNSHYVVVSFGMLKTALGGYMMLSMHKSRHQTESYAFNENKGICRGPENARLKTMPVHISIKPEQKYLCMESIDKDGWKSQ